MAKIEICWVLTPRCNENCKYCYRFLDIQENSYEKNEQILRKLISDGVKEITWTGGEALLYNGFSKLLKLAKESGVKSKLITNGTIVANNNDIREICDYLNSLTLSIDSINDDINIKLGRGKEHYKNVKTVLEYLKNKNLKTTINTVVSKVNTEYLEELGNFLKDYNIYAWRLFKFTPLRETAKRNQEYFDISDLEFNDKKKILNKFKDNFKIEYRQGDDFENKYLNIINDGEITKTENGVDIVIGKVLEDNFAKVLINSEQNSVFVNALKKLKKNRTVNKIRTFISLDDEKVRNTIINTLQKLDFVDIVGADNGKNSFEKIVELQPDIVFSGYEMKDIDGLELIEKSKEKLEDKAPVFNIVDGNIPFEKLMNDSNYIGDNINALVDSNDQNGLVMIMKEYKEYQEFMNN